MNLKSGIINDNNQVIELNNDEIISFLNNELNNLSDDDRMAFSKHKARQVFANDNVIIDFFVQFKNYIVIYNNYVYYQKGLDNQIFDRIKYVNDGFSLKQLRKMIFKDDKVQIYNSDIESMIEKIGFKHANSEENDLSFWYPKINNLGFKTPKTLITNFTSEEVSLIKRGKWDNIDEDEIKNRIIEENTKNNLIDLDSEMFLRLGTFSDKFNFQACHIENINDVYQKLMVFLDDVYFKLEWQEKINLVLREYIKTNYTRNTIYNGMPLNTEFRVFYDFDNNSILGIYNYWDTNTMIDNLRNKDDLQSFANNAKIIDEDFQCLKPLLNEEVAEKMMAADLNGKWSCDFLYNGNEFVLIDMAHAECSYYYDKVLTKSLKK